jgi:plasmid stabilization system protein ParE
VGHRLAPEARADLDEIWHNIAKESGNLTSADRVIDSIVERFYLLGQYPHLGRARGDLRRGLRSFPVGGYLILYRVKGSDAVILHIFSARRDIAKLID